MTQTTMTQTSKGRFGAVVAIVVTLLIGLASGYLLWGGDASSDNMAAEAAQHEQAATEFWTCSMHPQIHLPKPGKCPLCGMDLISADSGSGLGGLRRLTIRPEQRALMRVRTVPVEKRFPEAELRLVGKVTYDETRLGYITAWVPGRIDDLYVDYTGVTVRKGDHMVKLYSPDLYTAQQELLQAKASVVDLQESDIQSLREAALGTVTSAREKLRLLGLSAKQVAEIEQRGKPEVHVTIYSPSSGLVIHRNAQEGMYVQTGTRIFTIADLSRVWIQLDAYESDLQWLRYGQEVNFVAEAYAGRKFTGQISFIDPVLDRKTRTVKVRVNVKNDEGLLKPDMFVRAVVRSRITSDGPVMDASLAGKWICAMHPAVVKAERGECSVCGMNLVPAEDLGYVVASNVTEEAPLVVPVSATLMTGTRAIVYVELPDTEAPTYEGREVVLGPRAGNEYIIRHGLKEGELVVAEGNFKIDSALQILAKPSMMNPAGGQSSGGHNHGGSSGKEMEMPAEEMTKSALSEAAQARLQRIERLYAGITASIASGDLTATRRGFSDLGAAVKSTDMALFSDKSHEMWMELAMRLSNDAFEGNASGDVAAAAAVLKQLDKTVAMMRKQLQSRPDAAPPKQVDLSKEAAAKLDLVWGRYDELHAAFADDDLASAKLASSELDQAMQAIGAAELAESGRQPWMKFAAEASEQTSKIETVSEIATARAAFEKLSLASEALVRVLGSTTAMHVMQCPMAFDGRGARWLQSSKELLNPYFGASMLHCGSTLEVLRARETPSDK